MTQMISVSEAARRLGVSRHRIYARLRAGSVLGTRTGGTWLVDAASLSPALRGRPLSAPMALALAQMFDGHLPLVPFASQLARLREKAERIKTEPVETVIDLVRSWMAARAQTVELEAAPADLEAIGEDPRLLASGLSDPRTDLAVVGVCEGYIQRAELNAFADHHYLDPTAQDARPNVVVHVLDHPLESTGIAPRLLTAADLLDHHGPRETQSALRILGRA
ncbi:helix-turn-helix domain-containing protein [Ruania rhizosphaerae]|uniref:helix-turn-helix domain-containing protein n=1 Tax=Ruania rhizosphaerae TaxID=1840413 RepID=UPI00135B4A6B|nr:helix-turn-helix domain-containing protein [Ruania rhizosphaerae]